MAFTAAGGGKSWDREWLGPQWLQHTFGTLAAYDGANAYDLQDTMGHARLETSQRYTHMTHRLERSAAWKVNVETP